MERKGRTTQGTDWGRAGRHALVASFGCFTSSYGSGAQGARSGFTSVVLPLLITIVITLIFDLTHGQQGFVGISQQPMFDLQSTLASPSTP